MLKYYKYLFLSVMFRVSFRRADTVTLTQTMVCVWGGAKFLLDQWQMGGIFIKTV